MKRHILALTVALMLAGCVRYRDAYAFPTLDSLPAEAMEDCPAVEQVTGALGDLTLKDANLAILYAACQKKHRTARDAYLTAQQKLADAKAKAQTKETTSK